jgi:1-acyl-sn-glycerol-3-phosphate acyltransferase
MFDQFMIGAFISHYLTAIGATEIFKYPVWGQLLKKYGAIPIKRKRLKSAIKSLHLVEEAIHKGDSFLMAPEGTRTLNGEM